MQAARGRLTRNSKSKPGSGRHDSESVASLFLVLAVRCRRPLSAAVLEPNADAARDHIAFPVVQTAGIADVLGEFEVAGFVGALGVPVSAEVVADTAPQGIAMIQVRIGQQDPRQRRRFEPWSKFGLTLGFNESALPGTKLVLDGKRQFEQFHIVAVQHLSVYESRRHQNLAHFGVDPDGEIGNCENQAAVNSKLLGMSGVARNADFASRHDAWSAVLRGGLNDRELAVDVENIARDWRQVAELVGDLPDIQVKGPSLTIGRDRGQKEQEKQIHADTIRLAGLHQYVPSPSGQCTLPRIPPTESGFGASPAVNSCGAYQGDVMLRCKWSDAKWVASVLWVLQAGSRGQEFE